MFNCTRNTVVAISLLLANSALYAGEVINETREVNADALINIEVFTGTVSITGWDKNQFHIEGELSDQAEGYELRTSNGNIRFEEEIERSSFRNWGNFSRQKGSGADLKISVPQDSVLRFEGTNTDIDVIAINGNTGIEVVNGDIVARDLNGVISLETVNGSINSLNLNGRIDIDTVNGSIDDQQSSGRRLTINTINGSLSSKSKSERISAESVNGSIFLELDTANDLEASTVNGAIEVFTSLSDQARIDLHSVGGRIELTLPPSTSASFHASTAVGGRIRNELSDDEATRESRYVNSHKLNFVLNGGKSDINLTTVHGDIRIYAE